LHKRTIHQFYIFFFFLYLRHFYYDFKGIKGLKCDKLMVAGDSLCLSNPCWSGGTCRDLGSDWRCDCPLGYAGKNCRTVENVPCILNNPCKNNAYCLTVQNNGLPSAYFEIFFIT
jgi:hypothetical protein